MLQGHAVNAAAGGGAVCVEAGAGIGACGPDILEDAAAVFSDPETPVLVVPLLFRIGVSRAARVVGRYPRLGLILDHGAVTTYEFYIVDIRVFIGDPLQTAGTRVAASGVNTDTVDDIGTASGLYERLGRAHFRVGFCAFRKGELSGNGVQTDENGIVL